MAVAELEKYAIDHEMSINNQKSKARSLANTTQSWLHRYLQLCSFTLLHCTIFT